MITGYDMIYFMLSLLSFFSQSKDIKLTRAKSSVFNKRGQKMYALIGEISPLGLQFNFRELCSNYKNTKKLVKHDKIKSPWEI